MNLTPEETLQMRATLAEKCMGWKRMTNAQHQPGVYTGSVQLREIGKRLTSYYHNPDGSIACDFDGECDCGQTNTSWQPDANPAQAMEVLKKCVKKLSYSVGVIVGCSADMSTWYVQEEEGDDFQSEAATLELAICQFAAKLFAGAGE